MPYYFSDWTLIILIPAIILSFWAQTKVTGTYQKFSQVRCSRGYTGASAARKMLNANGLSEIPIYAVNGTLTDHFDPRNNSISLSTMVAEQPSIASVAVACHECGHAMQHNEGYALLRLRDNLVPLVNITSRFSWPVVMIGLIMMASGVALGGTLFNIGVILFGLVVLFNLVTLPVELNASNRALSQMITLGIVDQDEQAAAKQVLSAAAMTYVAALAVAVANLLRLLVISRSRRD
ncbi:MAG: zinc metallopeptidase [Clostridia bacterium]|nr:zinc metallopeptidase [Clostridia bacterium]